MSNIKAEDRFEAIRAAKARVTSSRPRGEDGKVIRKGRNLSGNTPWAPKLYAFEGEVDEVALKAAPNQVQLIVRWMVAHRAPATGGQIVEAMIEAGAIKTKIDPPVLFAYYRRLMERLGVAHVG